MVKATPTGLAQFGAMLSDPTRSEILCALLDGRAYTGSELARHVGVAASTVSEHMSKLLDADMVAVEAQGRHRYWRIANEDLALTLEQLGATVTTPPGPRSPSELMHRTCYDHLAGELAVTIYNDLLCGSFLAAQDDHVRLTDDGYALFAEMGVDIEAIRSSKRPKVRPCLDWTQRRHHLAGESGKQMLNVFMDKKWIRRGNHPRSIEISRVGRTELPAIFPSVSLS